MRKCSTQHCLVHAVFSIDCAMKMHLEHGEDVRSACCQGDGGIISEGTEDDDRDTVDEEAENRKLCRRIARLRMSVPSKDALIGKMTPRIYHVSTCVNFLFFRIPGERLQSITLSNGFIEPLVNMLL